jgi:hypothetical protein
MVVESQNAVMDIERQILYEVVANGSFFGLPS